MKLMTKSLAGLIVSAFLAPAALATGPEVFTAQKCNSCHSVKVAGIARLPNPDDDKAPDLSKVGAELDKKAIALFVLKKSEIKGEKHKKAFQGTTEELKTVAEWLAGLK
ncbi:MAG: c-type cytochrome [Deltaproteobacteria bacterium]|jgi:mono/diheme cytochrome c family protein|nr:c-type cytochrome [Deltaproteobacteria bacterium]